jgi:hypothetical protein
MGASFSLNAAVISAASSSRSDVQAALAAAKTGDTVQIPAGTNIYTSTVIVTNGISLIGAGIDKTVFIDEVPRNAANNQIIAFSGIGWRLSGITFRVGTTNTSMNWNGTIRIGGSGWRMDHVKFDGLQSVGGMVISSSGLVDHSVFHQPGMENFQTFEFGYGDNSWATPVSWGTTNLIYFEDNQFIDNGYVPAIDAYCGSRVVARYNTFTNSWLGNHGTDSSQRQRGARAFEVYGNDFYFPTGTPLTPWDKAIYMRSGSAVIFSNYFHGRFTTATVLANYRSILDGSVDGSPSWTPWGGATGTNPWDGNTDGTGYPCIDQCGRGTSDLITNSAPLNATTGTARWPHNQLEPIYSWGNVLNIDTSVEVGVQHPCIRSNRDFYVGTQKPGYQALVYPHPLVNAGTNRPAPPTNLRIIAGP